VIVLSIISPITHSQDNIFKPPSDRRKYLNLIYELFVNQLIILGLLRFTLRLFCTVLTISLALMITIQYKKHSASRYF